MEKRWGSDFFDRACLHALAGILLKKRKMPYFMMKKVS